MGSTNSAVSPGTRIEALFRNPALYEAADALPDRDPTLGGRPIVYPAYLVVAVDALAAVFGSIRSVFTMLHSPDETYWARIRTIVLELHPERPDLHLPERPPTREWFNRRRGLLLDNLERIQAVLEHHAVDQALQMGLMTAGAAQHSSAPDPRRMIHCDGKVITKPTQYAHSDTRTVETTDPSTGVSRTETRPRRACPDAKLHRCGDGRQIHGNKFWHAEARTSEPHERVILAMDHVPDIKGAKNSEADIAMAGFARLAQRLPGCQGVITDNVLRGVHLATLQRDHGWLVISPTTAASVDKKTGDRTLKTRPLRTVTFDYGDGDTDTVDVYTFGGALARRDTDPDTGEIVLIPLNHRRWARRANANGTYRSYAEYEVPCPRGGRPRLIRESTITDDDDLAKGFNRSEHIRQIPWTSPDYEPTYHRRSDAESINRGIDDALYLRRARSYGARAQHFNLLSHMLVVNSTSRLLHQRRTAAPLAA
jgi:hypothetical protein